MQNTQITLVGNLTDDPELKFTPSGAAVANFRVAVTDRVQRQGEWVDGETAFYRCAAWRGVAENVTESLTKGSRVLIVGTLRTRTWEGQDGQKRLDLEVNVDEIGPSLQWATAKPEKVRRDGQRQPATASKGGSFNDTPPF
jgi:single-strand DNA-binding protein